ncbi:hypothetical protein LWI28_015639 [Acer negundo]|uniref:Uncharacterized protein n=1 Tax=Acer negundo TaxID=4023 RepID=A0AAD5NXI6_ACENE|nr:hypothetical protein LWI28_015639 [Acer negundo]
MPSSGDRRRFWSSSSFNDRHSFRTLFSYGGLYWSIESQEQEIGQENESGGTSTSCGAVFARWLFAEKIELVVGDAAERDKEDDDDEEDDDMMPRRSQTMTSLMTL